MDEKIPLFLKLNTPDVQIKDIANTWKREYDNNRDSARQGIFELIFHCFDSNKQPLSETNFERIGSLTVDTFNEWVMNIRVPKIQPNHEFEVKILEFMESAFTTREVLNDEFTEAVYNFLSIMGQSHHETARYTASLFASIIIRTCMHCCLEKGAPIERLLQEAHRLLELVMLSLRDVAFITRKSCMEFYWSLCKKYQTQFMCDKSLYIVHSTLYDRNSHLRQFALDAVLFLIKHDKWIRDKEPIQSMLFEALIAKSFDSKKDIAIKGIETLCSFYSKFPQKCSESELQKVILLIFDKDQRVAKESAQLLYLTLQRFGDDQVEYIKQILNLLHNLEKTLNTNCEVQLLRFLFPFAGDYLTHWNAWREMLLGNHLSVELANLGCRLLLRIITYCSTYQLERDIYIKGSAPLNAMLGQKDTQRELTEELKHELELNQEAISNIFGANIIQLWEKYKHQPKCLEYLIKIPQVFLITDSLDLKLIFDYLISVKFESLSCMEQGYQTMAVIVNLMKSSEKWATYVPVVEEHLFSFCGVNFLKVCKRVATHEYVDSNAGMADLNLLKRAYYVTKYFDLTKTGFMQNAIIALKYGAEKNNSQIIRNAAYMCLYNVQWQLRNVAMENQPEEDLTSSKGRLQSYVSQTVYLIEPMITYSKSSKVIVRDAINIYSQLCILFSPKSVTVQNIPELKMSPLPLLICDWLNFHLVNDAPVTEVPEDTTEYIMAKCAIERICLLLSARAMNLLYFSCILPYFAFYDEEKNYNDVLQKAIEELVVLPDFCALFIESLANYKEPRTYDVTQVMIDGVCSGVQKLKIDKKQKFAISILKYGITLANTKKDVMLFPLFHPFVKLLSQEDARNLRSQVLELDPYISDDVYVKNFIMCLQNKISA